jgi:hypothetical protein
LKIRSPLPTITKTAIALTQCVSRTMNVWRFTNMRSYMERSRPKWYKVDQLRVPQHFIPTFFLPAKGAKLVARHLPPWFGLNYVQFH